MSSTRWVQAPTGKQQAMTIEREEIMLEVKACHAETVARLQKLMQSDEARGEQVTKTIQDQAIKLQEAMDQRLSEVNERLASLEKGMADLKMQNSIQAMQWALENKQQGRFEYKRKDPDRPRVNLSKTSESVVQDCLRAFIKNAGLVFGSDYQVSGDSEQFRAALAKQIYGLTGEEPRWARQQSGDYAIFRS